MGLSQSPFWRIHFGRQSDGPSQCRVWANDAPGSLRPVLSTPGPAQPETVASVAGYTRLNANHLHPIRRVKTTGLSEDPVNLRNRILSKKTLIHRGPRWRPKLWSWPRRSAGRATATIMYVLLSFNLLLFFISVAATTTPTPTKSAVVYVFLESDHPHFWFYELNAILSHMLILFTVK